MVKGLSQPAPLVWFLFCFFFFLFLFLLGYWPCILLWPNDHLWSLTSQAPSIYIYICFFFFNFVHCSPKRPSLVMASSTVPELSLNDTDSETPPPSSERWFPIAKRRCHYRNDVVTASLGSSLTCGVTPWQAMPLAVKRCHHHQNGDFPSPNDGATTGTTLKRRHWEATLLTAPKWCLDGIWNACNNAQISASHWQMTLEWRLEIMPTTPKNCAILNA